MMVKALLEAKQALEELDVEKIVDAYSQDAVFEDVPAGLRITNPDALRGYFEGLFSLPGVSFTGIRIYEGDSFAAIEWVWSGFKRNSKETYTIKGASVIELSDGKISRERIYYDPRPTYSSD